MSNQNDKKTRIFIQTSLSKEEKEKFKEFAKEKGISASDLMRMATLDYIRRSEHPETFNQPFNSQLNPVLIEQLTQNTKKMIELQELTLERTNVIKEMNKTLNLMKDFSAERGLEREKKEIKTLFKAHNSLSKQEIIDKTGLKKEIVLEVVSNLNNEKFIKLTPRGRFKLNE